jgi:hypothetical protein
MLRAYKHSTNELRALFNVTYQGLTAAGLTLYPTDCPDFRAKHPQNDIVFVILRFQEVSGTRIEIRVDSCPDSFHNKNARQPEAIRLHDAMSKASWAVYRIESHSHLEAAKVVIEKVRQIRPSWGN